MSDAPSGSSAVAVRLNWWESVASVYVSIVWFVGAEFEIALDDEFVVSVDIVAQLVATALCSQIISSDGPKFEDASVLAVSPEITVVFLNHLQVLAPVFSVSESGSLHEPALQVNVSFVYAGSGVMLGAPRVDAASG